MATVAGSEEKSELSPGDDPTNSWIECSVQRAQLMQKPLEETVDSAIEASGSRLSGVRSASSAHFYMTLSLVSRADAKVKEIKQFVEFTKAESEKLAKGALQAEKDMRRGRTKLRQVGNQIQGVISSAYKIEGQARGLKDLLGELPRREASQFRSQVSYLYGFLVYDLEITQNTCVPMQRSRLKGVKRSILLKETNNNYDASPSKNTISSSAIQRSHATEYTSRKDVVSWTRRISVLAKCGSSSEMALLEASQMRNCGIKPNSYTMVCLIQASTNLGYTSCVQQIHGYVLHSGFSTNVFVSTALIGCYSKWELLNDAHKVFVEITQPNIVTWNTLISGYVHNALFHKAVNLVLKLDRMGLRADSFTLSAALAACAQLSFLELGKSFHSMIVKFGLGWNIVVGNCLIDMYGKCGSPEEAIQSFNEIITKDTVSWNSVIGASARNGRLKEALSILLQMPVPDTISYNEVINGIAQFGDMEDAINILSRTPKPSVASWNSIVTGYVNRDQALEALDFFNKMHSIDISMDEFTFASILRGIASISALTWGTLIHCCLIKSGWDASIVAGSALIDMYSKCGLINSAESVFCWMPRRNLVSWNAMISGHAHNGNTSAVIRLFEKMKMVQEPDGITYLSVLSACGQDVGLSHLGIEYLESMTRDYGIEPTAEHCSCIIRVLGQRGEVGKAERMIHEMGLESCGLVWRALLGAACRASGDLKIAKVAAAKVLELEGDDEFVYVLLSNVYASHGKWGEVSAVREMMREKGLRKEAGYSWIEVENVVSTSSVIPA